MSFLEVNEDHSNKNRGHTSLQQGAQAPPFVFGRDSQEEERKSFMVEEGRGAPGGLQVGSRCEALGLGKLEAAPWRPSIPCDVTVDGLASWVGHGWGQGSEFHCHLALVCLYVQSLTLFRATSVHSVARSTQALKKQGAPGQVSAMV